MATYGSLKNANDKLSTDSIAKGGNGEDNNENLKIDAVYPAPLALLPWEGPEVKMLG